MSAQSSLRRGSFIGGSATHQAAAFRIHLLSGNSNPELAAKIGALLNVPVTNCRAHTKASGEVSVKVPLDVAGGDVYIVQPGCANAAAVGKDGRGLDVNDALFELLFLVRRARLCRAARITAIVPFFPYARQDRKTSFRCPLSAAAVSQFLETAGVDRVITMDLHSGQTQGNFNGRTHASLDDLPFYRDFAEFIKTKCAAWFNENETVIVSPDAGGVGRAKLLADTLGVKNIVTIIKRRAKAGVVETMQTVGDVRGMNCVILDDMIDSGGTLCKACTLLKSPEFGAKKVIACITHGILTDPALENLRKTDALEQLIISDTIPHRIENEPKLVVLPTAPALAKAVWAIHSELAVGQPARRTLSGLNVARAESEGESESDEDDDDDDVDTAKSALGSDVLAAWTCNSSSSGVAAAGRSGSGTSFVADAAESG
jgi:ribose-phosphate pyrophosphokinase